MLDSQLNLRYCLRGVGRQIRLVDLEVLQATGISAQKIEDLLLFGIVEDWKTVEIPDVTLLEVCKLAEASGASVVMDLRAGEEFDQWAQDVDTKWAPGETETRALSVVSRERCAVCRHPKRIEIEILMSKGLGMAKISKLFSISVTTLSKHRGICMAGRLDRLSQALGTAADVSSLVGTVSVMDGVMEFAKRAGEAALENREFAAVDSVVGKMLQGVEIRGKLTGEIGLDKAEETEARGGGSGGPQVSVLVVPTREQLEAQTGGRRVPEAIDVRGEPL